MENNKITSSIAGLAFLFFFFIVCPGIAGRIESTYKMEGIVVKREGEIIVFESNDGNLWEAEDTSVKVGDKIIATMDDKHTTTIYDDEIIKIKKIK